MTRLSLTTTGHPPVEVGKKTAAPTQPGLADITPDKHGARLSEGNPPHPHPTPQLEDGKTFMSLFTACQGITIIYLFSEPPAKRSKIET